MLWIISKLFSKVNFKVLYNISLFATMPKFIIGGFVNALAINLSNGFYLKKNITSLSIFLPEELNIPIVLNICNNIEVFSIWSLVLSGIGASIAMNISINKVLPLLLILWVIFIIIFNWIGF